MTDPVPPPPPLPPAGTAAARFRDRLLHPWSRTKDDSASRLPIVAPQRPVGFPASVAEFLLVFRLRARRRSTLSRDMMERALRVVLVTCKNWFSASDSPPSRSPRHD
jgi:hypothetical protein